MSTIFFLGGGINFKQKCQYIKETLFRKKNIHLCFNITEKGQMIEFLNIPENMVKTMFSNENLMKIWFNIV